MPERYGLTWPGKRRAVALANAPTSKVLRPVREKSSDFETTGNVFIEGDNLSVLKCLREAYLGRVKMIYIDPPYNTGGDFIYRDNFFLSKDEYLASSGQRDPEGGMLVGNPEVNGRFHTDWLNMMYPRLKVARDLLSDDGIIMISIDYNENFNLRAVCNEIFGESNFLGEIYWESKTKSQNTSSAFAKLQPKVEVILVYAKNQRKNFNLVTVGAKAYELFDEKGAYREYVLEEMNATGTRGRETMVYAIEVDGESVKPREGMQWKVGKETVEALRRAGDVLIRDGKVVLKIRPGTERAEKTLPFWGLIDKTIGTAESAKKELSEMMDGPVFETVKPVELIRKLVFHVTDPDDIVLDFFAGSGTTAHAVMRLNGEDGGRRRFILVQIDAAVTKEDVVPYGLGYRNIAEITRERIVRSGKRVLDETELTGHRPDTGFRYFRIDDANMRDVARRPDETRQDDLFAQADNIRADRTPEDLLVQAMLALGVTLDAPVRQTTVAGKTFYDVAEGYLLASFDAYLTDDVLEAMAKRKPAYAVVRDAGFDSDSVADNFRQIFKTYSPETCCKVI